MDSLVGYGSDDDNDNDRYANYHSGGSGAPKRREDDTNYDDVNMDMSDESQAESEPELPPVDAAPQRHGSRDRRTHGKYDESRSRGRSRSHERRDRRRESPARRDRSRDRPDRPDRTDRPDRPDRPERDRADRPDRPDRSRDHDRRSPRRDDKYRGERGRGSRAEARPPALMDLRPFGGEPPPRDARDAVSPRFVDNDRRDKDRERERDRDGRPNRRSEEDRRSRGGLDRGGDRGDRGGDRGRPRAAVPPPHAAGDSSSTDYRPSSYKVNKKLQVMEKMGLQIKTPDGSMTTAQQLRAAAGDAPRAAPSCYTPAALNSAKIMEQVNKRKLLWSNKTKSAEEEAAKWSGARFSQDSDGKQATKFMRLMGIKEPAAVKPEPDKAVDPNKKQEELFQAMQAQYEVARATTHTMRGVGLGFQRGQM